MKKKITALLLSAVFATCALSGCSNNSESENKEETGDVKTAVTQLTDILNETNDATSLDADELNSFFASIASAKYKLRGKASNYNCQDYNGYKIATVTLTVNDKKYIISLANTDDTITDGEYLEVEGNLGTSLSTDMSDTYGTFTLQNCTIVNRGDEAKSESE